MTTHAKATYLRELKSRFKFAVTRRPTYGELVKRLEAAERERDSLRAILYPPRPRE